MRPLLTSLLLLAAAALPAQSWKPLFNGQDLSGWKVLNGTAPFTVRDGMIVGTTVGQSPNTFLCTSQIYGDFILELEVWLDSSFNSGVQIRSESHAAYQNGRVHGYQVDLDPSPRRWSGGIYDEARRGWLYPLDVNPPARQAFRNGQWNHLHIEAIGASIRTWVNGIPCADLVDGMTAKGFIGLQVHSIGSPDQAGKEVRWRNLRIQTDGLVQRPWTQVYVVNTIPNYLSPQERAQGWRLLFDGKTTQGWRGAHKETFPEQGWKVVNGELRVEPSAGGESANGGDIVTLEEFTAFELALDFKLAPGANSGIKYFVTEQYPTTGSAIGLEYQLLDDALHPDAKEGAAGNRKLGSLYDLIPAHSGKMYNPPGEWNHARVVVSGTRTDLIPAANQTEHRIFRGAQAEHWLNHRLVVRYDRGTQMFDALVARSKYAGYQGFGQWQTGRILLQDHGNEVHFRSIKVRPLAP
ncbi:MAG: DUF1080 domain-containing protein [Bacteroidia bacterium]|nr:DUF1080 domain-containing protein [Bacteroidia bacterium]